MTASFTMFDANDVAVGLAVQSVYGTAVTPSNMLMARSVSVVPVRPENVSIGTASSRSAIAANRAKGQRIARLTVEAEIYKTAAIDALLTLIFGASSGAANLYKFGTLSWRNTGGAGIVLSDVAIDEATIRFGQQSIVSVTAAGNSYADWNASGSPSSGSPLAAVPIIVDDTSLTFGGVDIFFESITVSVSTPLSPVYGMDIFPVGFHAPHDREVRALVSVLPTSVNFGYLASLASDATGNLVIASPQMTMTLKNAVIASVGLPDFETIRNGNMLLEFVAYATDDSTTEVAIS